MKPWKIIGLALLGYSIVAGLLTEAPRLPVLNETIRNLYYHVPMWFTMIALLGGSLVHSIKHLSSGDLVHDSRASQHAQVAMLFAALGLLTGMVWAKFTWGAFWTNDPKLKGTAVSMLIYAAYFVLRNSVDDAK